MPAPSEEFLELGETDNPPFFVVQKNTTDAGKMSCRVLVCDCLISNQESSVGKLYWGLVVEKNTTICSTGAL
jgi:hypothetical protein